MSYEEPGLSIDDVDCLISPYGCFGEPHRACIEADVPIIVVRENRTSLKDEMPSSCIFVENCLEAVGVLVSMRAGVYYKMTRRPVSPTVIYKSLRGK